MLPPLKSIEAGLHRATETLAAEIALPGPGGAMPDWNELEWRLAMAVAAAHGVSSILCGHSSWQHPEWRQFLANQRDHVECRHRRIAALLKRIDGDARSAGLAVVALKGSALHALGIYAPGDRPMADIDLLVREGDAGRANELLRGLGYLESFVVWKHRVFKPAAGRPVAGLGEHRDTPINIELHTRIQERLPVATVDITARIYPQEPRPGLNAYPSIGALMSHLLLHAAGNICSRSLRLLHLHDIALLSARMTAGDWGLLWGGGSGADWWAFAPPCLVARYYSGTIPGAVLERLWNDCPPLLRMVSRRQTLTRVSCSELWHHTLHGIEWLHSLRDIGDYVSRRIHPPQEALDEHADMLRTQLWLQEKSWVSLPRGQRMLALLKRPMPRMDIMYAVRAALEPLAPTTSKQPASVIMR